MPEAQKRNVLSLDMDNGTEQSDVTRSNLNGSSSSCLHGPRDTSAYLSFYIGLEFAITRRVLYNASVMLIPLVYVSLGQAVTLSWSLHRSRWRERGLGAHTHRYRRPVHHEPAQAPPRAALAPAPRGGSRSSAPRAAAPGRPLRRLFSSNGIGQDNKIITTWPLLG